MLNHHFDHINYWERVNQPTFDPVATEKLLVRTRNKVAGAIREHMKEKDMTTTETASATKMARCCIAKIVKGDLRKISLDRLMRITYRLGIDTKITIKTN